MKVDYITHSGDDKLVSNVARVSFLKWKTEFDAKDEKLINYLADHKHWTPFSHPQITVRVKAPIFVARQLFKHKVGLTENEVSRRYVDEEPEFYWPDKWRKRAENKKQGSSDEEASLSGVLMIYGTGNNFQKGKEALEFHNDITCKLYRQLLSLGVAPEQARMILPQNMYTQWIWTGSLAAFARMYGLRSEPDAQQETREIAEMISKIIEPLYPVSWKALTK